jgi:hypothetical protein
MYHVVLRHINPQIIDNWKYQDKIFLTEELDSEYTTKNQSKGFCHPNISLGVGLPGSTTFSRSALR